MTSRSTRKLKVIPKTSVVTSVNAGIGQLPVSAKKKSLIDVYLLVIFLGFFGAHHFYLGRPFFGVVYLCTFGLLGVGYVTDLFRAPCLLDDEYERQRNPSLNNKKSLFDAYLLWFPLGILGLHHFYLRQKWKLGLIYLFTAGLFGIGWLVDLYRLPFLVTKANSDPPAVRTTCKAYIFALSPFGPFGAHHFYLNRTRWGWLYLFTFGIFGVGWIIDMLRLPKLVERAAKGQTGAAQDRIYLDDAYVLWLWPLGMMGAHQFYIGRPGWGKLYFFTLGIFGVGWLIDFFRMPCLVEDFNKQYQSNNVHVQGETSRLIGSKNRRFPPQQHLNGYTFNQQFPVRQLTGFCDSLDRVCL